MAKKHGASIHMDIKNVPLKKLLNIDISTLNRMDVSTLGAVTKRLVSTANRRLTDLEKHKVQHLSNAYIGRKQVVKAEARQEAKRQKKLSKGKKGSLKLRTGGKGGRKKKEKLSLRFVIKDNTRNQYLKVVSDAKKFLESPTSTPQGVEKVRNSIINAVGRDLTEAESRRMWKLYNKLLNTNDNEYRNILEYLKSTGYGSQQIINDIAKRVARRKYDGIAKYEKSEDILNRWRDELDRQYGKLFAENDTAFNGQDEQKEIIDPDALEQGDFTKY